MDSFLLGVVVGIALAYVARAAVRWGMDEWKKFPWWP